MIDTYYTIKHEAEGTYKEKGSKFYAFAFPVFSEEEATAQLKTLQKNYHDARHHVYAFRLGADMEKYRYNDDGEPPNSSGPQVLGKIQSFGVTNIIIIVVRYFGGRKLGIPGLINAYKTASRNALSNARIISRTIDDLITIKIDYTEVDKVMNYIKKENMKISDQQFGKDCRLTLSIPKNQTKGVLETLRKLNTFEQIK